MLNINQIRVDGGTQARAGISEATVDDYAEQMLDPTTVFPPVIVYHDGSDYWLADGFHRLAAWRKIGRTEVPAEIRMGTRRDAVLHACGANAAHGLRRTNADKRQAAETLLRDPEWSQWSDREIARRCRVSHPFVRRLREEIAGDLNGNISIEADNPLKTNEPERRKFVDRYGNVSKRRVERIGNAAPQHTGNISSETPNPLKTQGADRRKFVDRHGNETVMRAGRSEMPHRSTLSTVDSEAPNPLKTNDPESRGADTNADPLAIWRKGLSSLTREGLEDEVAGLRAENAELRGKIRDLRAENASLKDRIKVFEAEGDLGRKLGNALREIERVRGRSTEWQAEAARLKRRVLAQDAEIKRLRAEIEGQEIAL